jgi:hypothetical protein
VVIFNFLFDGDLMSVSSKKEEEEMIEATMVAIFFSNYVPFTVERV